jgi:hypothetical protein
LVCCCPCTRGSCWVVLLATEPGGFIWSVACGGDDAACRSSWTRSAKGRWRFLLRVGGWVVLAVSLTAVPALALPFDFWLSSCCPGFENSVFSI